MLILVNRQKKFNNYYLKTKGVLKVKNSEIIKIEFKWKNFYYHVLKIGEFAELKLIEKFYKVLIKNIFAHPYKKILIHVDFLKLNE